MATISCPNCNAQLDENKKFCTECGTKLTAPVTEEVKDEIAMQQTQKFSVTEDKNLEEAVKAVFRKDDDEEEDKKAKRKTRKEKKKEKKEALSEDAQQTIVDFSALAGSTLDDSPYEPISAWGYIGIWALFAIPVIGWIFAIVWACGGCRKLNKRNMARGYLLVLALLGIFMACALLAVWKIAPAYMDMGGTEPVVAEEEIYTVEGTNPSEEAEQPAEEFEEGENSLVTYLREVGDEIWNAYYDRTLPGGEELTAILDGDRDTLLNLGYSEKSVDQVLNMVNGDFEALSSLLNLIDGQEAEATEPVEEVTE